MRVVRAVCVSWVRHFLCITVRALALLFSAVVQMSCYFAGVDRILVSTFIGSHHGVFTQSTLGRSLPEEASPSEALASAIRDLEDADVRNLCEKIRDQLPSAPAELLVDSNEVRDTLATLASVQLTALTQLRELQAKVARQELRASKLMKTIVAPTSHTDEEERKDAQAPTDDRKDAGASAASVASCSAEEQHASLLLCEDLPHAQRLHRWNEHRARFPDCSTCNGQ